MKGTVRVLAELMAPLSGTGMELCWTNQYINYCVGVKPWVPVAAIFQKTLSIHVGHL